MKIKPFISIVLVVALSTGIYLWLNGRNSAVVAEIATSKAQYQTPVAVPEVPEPLAVPEAPEKPALPIPDADTNPRAFRLHTDVEGHYSYVRSIDLINHYRFMQIGVTRNDVDMVVLNADGTPAEAHVAEAAEARLRKSYLEETGLTDQELEKLLDVARSSLQADRQYQSEVKAQTCAARATFRNIEDFGAELNNNRQKVQLNQEKLGREAPEKLGAALFSKIEARRTRDPRSSVGQGVDFTKLFVAQHRDLETEIKRFCDGPGH